MGHKEDFRQETDVLVLLKYIENYFMCLLYIYICVCVHTYAYTNVCTYTYISLVSQCGTAHRKQNYIGKPEHYSENSLTWLNRFVVYYVKLVLWGFQQQSEQI